MLVESVNPHDVSVRAAGGYLMRLRVRQLALSYKHSGGENLRDAFYIEPSIGSESEDTIITLLNDGVTKVKSPLRGGGGRGYKL
jgi:hypothetical protein